MNFNPGNFGNPFPPQFSQNQLTIPKNQEIAVDLASFSLPGFNLSVSDNGLLLSLEWKNDEEYSKKAVQQLRTAIQDLPISVRFNVTKDIFSGNGENAGHFLSYFGEKIRDLIVRGDIWGAPVNDKVVQKSLGFCPNVKRVECSWGDGITGEFIAHLPESVKHLNIGTCRTLQEKYLSALKECHGLETFRLQNYISREDAMFGLSVPDFKGTFIKDLPSSLRSLTLIQYEFDDEKLLHLGKLSHLEHLAFEFCIYFKGSFIEHLNPELVSLDLNGCKAVKNENLECLAGFKKLRKLTFPQSLSAAVENLSHKLQKCEFIRSRY